MVLRISVGKIWRSREVVVALHPALGSPHLEYSVWFWTTHYEKNTGVQEHVKKRATKLVKDLQPKPSKEKLRKLGLF